MGEAAGSRGVAHRCVTQRCVIAALVPHALEQPSIVVSPSKQRQNYAAIDLTSAPPAAPKPHLSKPKTPSQNKCNIPNH
jgi:hypothetical protein